MLSSGKGAPSVLKAGSQEFKGSDAKLSIILGATAVSDLVKTMLGPKSMDKILTSRKPGGSVIVTNDGATVLKRLHLDNPAAKIMVDMSKTQDEEVGDGTTSVCVLAGQLLHEAEGLLDARVHPQTIAAGWRLATTEARACLEDMSMAVDRTFMHSQLIKVAKTVLSSKIVDAELDLFAELAVNAVERLGGSGILDNIQIIKKQGGSMRDSYLEPGFVLDKRIGVGQPKVLENARILVANTPMDTDKVKIYGAKVKTDSMSKVADIEEAETRKMMTKCQKIVDHGVNCFINRQLIYNKPEQFFTDAGVLSIEHADFDGIERLAAVLGAEIVSTFDSADHVKLGKCEKIEEVLIGEDRAVRFSGCSSGAACTIVLRGSSPHLLDEVERSLHDALCVLVKTIEDPRVVWGGGNSELRMAAAVDELAVRTPGKRALAIEAFGRALRELPKIIADNGGYDSGELISQVRAALKHGDNEAGLDMEKGEMGNMSQLSIMDSFRVKRQVLVSAAEAAEMVLRCDEVIQCAPRERADPHCH